MKSVKELRDKFKEIVEICDEVLELEEREKEGQDVSKEYEGVIGRFFLKFMELDALK